MMKYPNQKIVARVREQFPEGCRVVLDKMDDLHAPPIGTEGSVIYVDDVATIHVSWDNGGSLGVAFGQDQCHRI